MSPRQDASASFSVGLLAIVAGLALLGWAALLDDPEDTSFFEGGFAVVLGVALLGRGLYLRVAHGAFAQTSLQVAGPVRLGGVVEAVLVLDVRRPVRLEPAGCTATLHSLERCWSSRDGASSGVKTHEVSAQVRPLDLPAVLDAPVQRQLTFSLPKDAPPSWRGTEHAFITEVVVQVALAGRPDVTLVTPVTVLPELA